MTLVPCTYTRKNFQMLINLNEAKIKFQLILPRQNNFCFRSLQVLIFFRGSTAPSGPGPPHC